MRLISQDGKFDIPYDEIVVELFDKCVVGRLKEYVSRDIILGSYSTEEKAEKAMEMLHDAYLGKDRGYRDDNGGLLYRQAKTTDCNIFRFPADEDVNVMESLNDKTFGEKLKSILRYKGISQKELSKMVCCSDASLSRYITNDRNPKAQTVKKIADALGVSVECLISDSDL